MKWGWLSGRVVKQKVKKKKQKHWDNPGLVTIENKIRENCLKWFDMTCPNNHYKIREIKEILLETIWNDLKYVT